MFMRNFKVHAENRFYADAIAIHIYERLQNGDISLLSGLQFTTRHEEEIVEPQEASRWADPLPARRIMQKITVEISAKGYTGLTAENIEKALSHYFGSPALGVSFSVTESAQYSVQRIGGTCAECDSEILPSQYCMMGHWCGVPANR